MAGRSKTNRRAVELERFVEAALGHGALRAKLIRAADVETAAWVRWKCRFGCDGYGSTRMCPPHSPTPDETRSLLDGYSHAVLYEAPRNRSKAIAVQLEREVFLAGYYKALGLGAGPCNLCRECGFDRGCRHAEQARPAMEACGIDVFATVRKQGFDVDVVRNHKDPQHYFGLVLID